MNTSTRSLVRAAILLALLLSVQSLRLGQGFTGPAVNAILFLAVAFVGTGWAVAIGAVSPWAALLTGILPPPLAPAVPFIMLGNAVLALLFGIIRPVNPYLGVLAASVAKFAVIAGAVRFIIAVPPGAAVVLGIPQLVTALAGGAIALLVLAAAPVLTGHRNRV